MELLVKPEILTSETTYMVWPCSKNGRGTIAQDSIEVDARAAESTRETEEKRDGRSKEGHEREEPARRAVGRQWSLGVGQRGGAF
jgi:hypothetical protein